MSESKTVATTHTHGDYLSKTDDDFSRTGSTNDIKTANGTKDDPAMTMYVSTPNGSVLKYDPKTGSTTTIATDLASSSKDPTRKNDISPFTGNSEKKDRQDIMRTEPAKQDAIPKSTPPPPVPPTEKKQQ